MKTRLPKWVNAFFVSAAEDSVFTLVSSFRTAKIVIFSDITKAQGKKMQVKMKIFFAALREKLALRFGFLVFFSYLCSAKQ